MGGQGMTRVAAAGEGRAVGLVVVWVGGGAGWLIRVSRGWGWWQGRGVGGGWWWEGRGVEGGVRGCASFCVGAHALV